MSFEVLSGMVLTTIIKFAIFGVHDQLILTFTRPASPFSINSNPRHKILSTLDPSPT